MAAALNARFLGTLSRLSIGICGGFLDFMGDESRKDRLQPFRWTTATNPRMGSRNRAGENRGEFRSAQGKAFVPVHGRILPKKKKDAMRKIILATVHALRILSPQ